MKNFIYETFMQLIPLIMISIFIAIVYFIGGYL